MGFFQVLAYGYGFLDSPSKSHKCVWAGEGAVHERKSVFQKFIEYLKLVNARIESTSAEQELRAEAKAILTKLYVTKDFRCNLYKQKASN